MEVAVGAFVDVVGGACVLDAVEDVGAEPVVVVGCSCVGGAGLGVAVLAGTPGVAAAGDAWADTPGLAEIRA